MFSENDLRVFTVLFCVPFPSCRRWRNISPLWNIHPRASCPQRTSSHRSQQGGAFSLPSLSLWPPRRNPASVFTRRKTCSKCQRSASPSPAPCGRATQPQAGLPSCHVTSEGLQTAEAGVKAHCPPTILPSSKVAVPRGQGVLSRWQQETAIWKVESPVDPNT